MVIMIWYTHSNLEFIDFLLILKHGQCCLQLAYFGSESFNREVSFFDGTILVSIARILGWILLFGINHFNLSFSFLISAFSFAISAFRAAISLSLSSHFFFQSVSWSSYLDWRLMISVPDSEISKDLIYCGQVHLSMLTVMLLPAPGWVWFISRSWTCPMYFSNKVFSSFRLRNPGIVQSSIVTPFS